MRRVVGVHKSHHVALGVRELSENHHARDLCDGHDGLAAFAFDLVEVGLRVVDSDVEGDLPGATVAPTAATADTASCVSRVYDSIVHRIIGVDLPAEDAGVEVLQLLAVFACDLEMYYWIRHGFLLTLMIAILLRGTAGTSPPPRRHCAARPVPTRGSRPWSTRRHSPPDPRTARR